ncbi:hypothetical protein SLS56_012122 [Neofusicoccum ribis]|uniref:mitogen-activated protein kinase n=1 Tax=Neofusicoccum ribis TaxID=45134 RepID=A0ABR3SB60_9PEZI
MAHKNSPVDLLFALFPLNEHARELVQYEPNSHLVSVVDISSPAGKSYGYGLNIEAQILPKSPRTLITIGRDADILVPIPTDAPDACISRVQCSFEIQEETGEILLQDRSSFHNTQFHGDDAFPFQSERVPRRVLVRDTMNTMFGFGNPDAKLFLFRIAWPSKPRKLAVGCASALENPRMMRTQELQREHSSTEKASYGRSMDGESPPLRYIMGRLIDIGVSRNVYESVDVDSGRLLAVKTIDAGTHSVQDIERELAILKSLWHPNILEFIAAQTNGSFLEIITPLKHGNVRDLIKQGVFPAQTDVISTLTHHMLQALDYISIRGIVHRDIKPQNILYRKGPGFLFQLADFGSSNWVSKARTFVAGSPIWMAPEIMANNGIMQTPKVDVWSLYVVIVQVLNVRGFHDKTKEFKEGRDIFMALEEAYQDDIVAPLRPMAHIDPEQRASAAEMLDALFNGVGRAILRNTSTDISMADRDSMPCLPLLQQSKNPASWPHDNNKGAQQPTSKQLKSVAKGTKTEKVGSRRRHQVEKHKLIR